jgi:hypothetical protein
MTAMKLLTPEEWGSLRSACARRSWMEAWDIVGLDHDGDLSPQEVYLLNSAKEAGTKNTCLALWYTLMNPRHACVMDIPKGRIARIRAGLDLPPPVGFLP